MLFVLGKSVFFVVSLFVWVKHYVAKCRRAKKYEGIKGALIFTACNNVMPKAAKNVSNCFCSIETFLVEIRA